MAGEQALAVAVQRHAPERSQASRKSRSTCPLNAGFRASIRRTSSQSDYLWELPFGHDRRWLTGNKPMRWIFGDWQWSGDWTIASGLPFTPRLRGQRSEVERGTNGTLRPDVVPGQSIKPIESVNCGMV